MSLLRRLCHATAVEVVTWMAGIGRRVPAKDLTGIGGVGGTHARVVVHKRVLDRPEFRERVRAEGEHLLAGLRALVDDGLAREARGRGLMCAIRSSSASRQRSPIPQNRLTP